MLPSTLRLLGADRENQPISDILAVVRVPLDCYCFMFVNDLLVKRVAQYSDCLYFVRTSSLNLACWRTVVLERRTVTGTARDRELYLQLVRAAERRWEAEQYGYDDD